MAVQGESPDRTRRTSRPIPLLPWIRFLGIPAEPRRTGGIPRAPFYAGTMSTSGYPVVAPSPQRARAESGRFWPRLRAALGRSRAWIHRHPNVRAPYRVLVALAGATVIVIGLILVPLPGPGWLIVFVGVAMLGTEFPAAQRLTRTVQRLARRVRVAWRARRARQAARSGVPASAV